MTKYEEMKTRLAEAEAERDAAVERVIRAERERNEAYDLLDKRAAMDEYNIEIRRELDDLRNSMKHAMSGHEDEQHCACFPYLRAEVTDLRTRLAEAEGLLRTLGHHSEVCTVVELRPDGTRRDTPERGCSCGLDTFLRGGDRPGYCEGCKVRDDHVDAISTRLAETDRALSLLETSNESRGVEIARLRRRLAEAEGLLREVATYNSGPEEDAGGCWCPAEWGEQSTMPHSETCRRVRAFLCGGADLGEPKGGGEAVAVPLTFRRLQDEQRPWVQHNFAGREPFYPLLGAMEELGELSHAHLKALQGIRTGENHDEAKRDAVADIVIFLADYCTANEIDFQDAVEETWARVKQRDWKADPKNGAKPPTPEPCGTCGGSGPGDCANPVRCSECKGFVPCPGCGDEAGEREARIQAREESIGANNPPNDPATEGGGDA